jgi:lipopolysaccharide biosynthesis protein
MRTPVNPPLRSLARQFLLIVKEQGFVRGEYLGAVKDFADEGVVGADMSHKVQTVKDGGDCLGVFF